VSFIFTERLDRFTPPLEKEHKAYLMLSKMIEEGIISKITVDPRDKMDSKKLAEKLLEIANMEGAPLARYKKDC